MQEKTLAKTEMARRRGASRAHLDLLFDPENDATSSTPRRISGTTVKAGLVEKWNSFSQRCLDKPMTKKEWRDHQRELLSKQKLRPLGGGLWEARSTLAGNRIARVLFCTTRGHMVLLHTFIKKTQKTPEDELHLARKRQKDLTL